MRLHLSIVVKKFMNKHIRYPRNIDNPDIEDIIEYNNLMDKELSFFDIKNIERMLWHDKLGPIYENIQEDIYENLNSDMPKKTDYIYNNCKGIIYMLADDNELKKINHHGIVQKKYVHVFTDINNIDKVKHDIKKQGNLHLIKIDLNKYSNKLRFYIDPATVNYKAFVTREYIPKYCCEEIK